MAEYQERVLNEKDELDTKIHKLRLFFSSDIFRELSFDEQSRLSIQLGLMQQYSNILQERINAWPKSETQD